MSTAQETPELINLVFTDWNSRKEAHLHKVSRNATVGEVLGEVVRAMELPFQSAFQAVFRGRALNNSETLEELGIESDEKLEVVPQVSAG